MKNVLAIAAGLTEGLNLGENARAAILARGIKEIIRLTVAFGGKKETVIGLSGIGDIVLTCVSKTSRNYKLGYMLGKGESLSNILKNVELAKSKIYKISEINDLTYVKSFTNFVAIDCAKNSEYAKKVMENLINLGIFIRMPSVAPLNRCIRLTVGNDLDLDYFASSLKLAL